MGNSVHQPSRKHDSAQEYVPNAFDLLPRELHELIGGYVIGSQPVRIDQILGYLLVSKYWTQTVFSGPIRLVAFNKHRVSLDMLERIGAFNRLSFCLDLRYCQPLGNDEDFLEIMKFHNIYELDLRGIEFNYNIDPDLGHLTSLRRLAISQNIEKPDTQYAFISKLTKLNSLIIEQIGSISLDNQKLDLKYFLPLTNLKELVIHPFISQNTILDSVTKLTSLQALVLNFGYYSFDLQFDFNKLTTLTNLKTLAAQQLIHNMPEESIRYFTSLKWQTSLERIYDAGSAQLAKYNPIWTVLPEKKFQISETIVVDVLYKNYKVGFY